MQPGSVTSTRRDTATGGALAVVGSAAVFLLITSVVSHATSYLFVAAVTAVVAGCGMALAGAMRLLSAAAASVGRWLRRATAGALLLTPAAMLANRPFLARGWDFDTCGSLIARHHHPNLPDFERECAIAAPGRLVPTLVLIAAACLVAIAYGFWLRPRLTVRLPADQ